MILVLGKYTKKAAEFSKLDKTYEAEMTLGATSSTGDSEGVIKPTDLSKSEPSWQQVRVVLDGFIGEGLQVPPAHSAIKIDGQRAYKLARLGKPVKIEPRNITIYGINDVAYNYPRLLFTVSVSSGTYIRSLATDIGEKLDTGAYLSNLRRISVNNFNVKDAISADDLNFERIRQNLQLDTGVAKVL
jgi:tRNA pseudouridine55 synthase